VIDLVGEQRTGHLAARGYDDERKRSDRFRHTPAEVGVEVLGLGRSFGRRFRARGRFVACPRTRGSTLGFGHAHAPFGPQPIYAIVSVLLPQMPCA
jgi:hypothetical protein